MQQLKFLLENPSILRQFTWAVQALLLCTLMAIITLWFIPLFV